MKKGWKEQGKNVGKNNLYIECTLSSEQNEKKCRPCQHFINHFFIR